MVASTKELLKALGKDADLVTVTEGEDAFGVRLKRFEARDVFTRIKDILRDYEGRYSSEKRGWVVPLVSREPVGQGTVETKGGHPYEGLDPELRRRAMEADAEAAKRKENVADEGYKLVSIDKLQSPAKPLRQGVDEDYIAELVNTVRSQGIIEPIRVRPKDGGRFEVVAGEQRLRAARTAGLKTIPAIVKQMSDWEAFETGLTENLQRKNLTDYEVAKALDRALKDFGEQFPDQKTLAFSLGKSENWVSNHLAILELEGKIPARTLQEMTHTQARELRSVPEEKHEAIVKEVAKSGVLPSSREIGARPHPKPTEVALPCESCSNDIACGRVRFHVDDKGDYVCEHQNKPLKEEEASASELIPQEHGVGSESIPQPTREVKAWWSDFKDIIPRKAIDDVDKYVAQGGDARKKKFLPFYLTQIYREATERVAVEYILKEADRKLSDAMEAEAKQ